MRSAAAVHLASLGVLRRALVWCLLLSALLLQNSTSAEARRSGAPKPNPYDYSRPGETRDLNVHGDPQKALEVFRRLQSFPEFRDLNWKEFTKHVEASRNKPGHSKPSVEEALFNELPREVAKAIREYINERPELAKLNLEKWRTDKAPSLDELYHFFKLSREQFPGGQIELGLILDPVTFLGPRRKIHKAWNDRPMSEVGDALTIDTYLAARAGKTIVMVGHVEGKNFVMRDGENNIRRSLAIPELMVKAEKHGVLLVPIGCRSGMAGAPFGFIKNITTDQVAAILKTLPAQNPTLGDLLVSMRSAGEVYMNFTRTLEGFYSVTVKERAQEPPSVILQIPSNFGSQQSSLANAAEEEAQLKAFKSIIAQKSADHLPWWKSSTVIRDIRALTTMQWLSLVGFGAFSLLFKRGLDGREGSSSIGAFLKLLGWSFFGAAYVISLLWNPYLAIGITMVPILFYLGRYFDNKEVKTGFRLFER